MTTNTDPVRALIGEMTDYLDQEVDPELDVIEQWRDRLESALASAPPSAPVGVEQCAREAVALSLDERGFHGEAQNVREGFLEDLDEYRHELLIARIAAALAQQPAAPTLNEPFGNSEQLPQAGAQQGDAIESWCDMCGFTGSADLSACPKCGHDEMRVASALSQQPAAPSGEAWRPMETAPRDGTIVRLLVEFTDHALEDTDQAIWTIGHNNLAHDGEDLWQFAGWCWEHDHYTSGEGTPIGWLPLLDAAPQQPAGVDEFADDRERLLRAFMMECGIIGAKEAGVNLARGIKAALAAQQQGGA